MKDGVEVGKVIGERIKNRREKLGWTQRDLANKLDLTIGTVSGYERDYRTPDLETAAKIASILNCSVDYLLGLTEGLSKYELPSSRTNKIPILGTIRAGIPLLSEQNVIGHLDIPSDIVNKADFALVVNGDSMIGAGISDRDIVICKQQEVAINGQIVVALVNTDETTLKFYIKDNGQAYLRAANPEYPDFELKPGDKIQGYVLRVQKEAPSPNSYREYLYFRDGHLYEWNEVVEKATSYGIKPDKVKSILDMHWEMVNRK